MLKINFRRNFVLKDNGDLTQNLYSKCYQNNLLISEIDLGNIEDIVCLSKENIEFKERLEQKNKVIEEAIKYIDGTYEMACYTKTITLEKENIDDLRDILNKGVDE